MEKNLKTMNAVVERGLSGVKSVTSFTGGDAKKLNNYLKITTEVNSAMGASLALMTADMALAGITSVILADEVIQIMHQIRKRMSTMFKETAEGGLAITPTGLKIMEQLFNNTK